MPRVGAAQTSQEKKYLEKLCEHIKDGTYSLLWWTECPECYDGKYIIHRCLSCKEEFKQGERDKHLRC